MLKGSSVPSQQACFHLFWSEITPREVSGSYCNCSVSGLFQWNKGRDFTIFFVAFPLLKHFRTTPWARTTHIKLATWSKPWLLVLVLVQPLIQLFFPWVRFIGNDLITHIWHVPYIDTIKTRLQSQQGFLASGGFRGVYSGLLTAVIGSAPGGNLDDNAACQINSTIDHISFI